MNWVGVGLISFARHDAVLLKREAVPGADSPGAVICAVLRTALCLVPSQVPVPPLVEPVSHWAAVG